MPCCAADVEWYLPTDLLVKMDIATMANSLEARSPFLDWHLTEFAAKLPSGLKVKGRTSKYILKKAVADLVPAENMHRPKQGFAVPVGGLVPRRAEGLSGRSRPERAVCTSRGLFRPDGGAAALRRSPARRRRSRASPVDAADARALVPGVHRSAPAIGRASAPMDEARTA